MVDYKKQGKKNRASGARFELKVRKDLESKGWIVDKWTNQVEWLSTNLKKEDFGKEDVALGKLVKVKNLFRGKNIPMMLGAGFPDFVAFKLIWRPEYKSIEGLKIKDFVKNWEIIQKEYDNKILYEIIGVEVKSNGTLSKIEKEKCRWYLSQNIFSKILIASKSSKRGEIVYKEFERKKYETSKRTKAEDKTV